MARRAPVWNLPQIFGNGSVPVEGLSQGGQVSLGQWMTATGVNPSMSARGTIISRLPNGQYSRSFKRLFPRNVPVGQPDFKRHPAFRYLKAYSALIRATNALNKWNTLNENTRNYRLTRDPAYLTERQIAQRMRNKQLAFARKVADPNYDPMVARQGVATFAARANAGIDRVINARQGGGQVMVNDLIDLGPV